MYKYDELGEEPSLVKAEAIIKGFLEGTNVHIKKSNLDTVLDDLIKNKIESKRKKCLHELCPNCHGTGRSIVYPHFPCAHMISCPCEKCSPVFY